MISGRQIFQVAWPYSLSMATGFIIQGVDSAMVASLGTTALAALSVVGVTSFIPNSFTMGLITAVQKRTALTDQSEVKMRALSGGLMLALILSLPFVLGFYFFADNIAGVFTSGESLALCSTFLKIFCFSFFFSSMNQALSGFWIGNLKSKTRLTITLFTTVVNVVGNLILTPHLGFRGVALASTVAIFSGFILNLYLSWKLEGFRFRRPIWSELKEDLRTVFGVSLHQISLSLTLNAAAFIVGLISVQALAVANVIGMLSLPALYLGLGYGIATGSFLSRTLAMNDFRQTREISHKALWQVAGICFGLSLLILTLAPWIQTFFFKDEATRQLATLPLKLLSLLYIIDGICCALQRFHFVGDGLRKSFLIMSTIQWLVFVPSAYLAVHYLRMGYSGYLMFHLGQRALIALILYLAWRQRTPVQKFRAVQALDLNLVSS